MNTAESATMTNEAAEDELERLELALTKGEREYSVAACFLQEHYLKMKVGANSQEEAIEKVRALEAHPLSHDFWQDTNIGEVFVGSSFQIIEAPRDEDKKRPVEIDIGPYYCGPALLKALEDVLKAQIGANIAEATTPELREACHRAREVLKWAKS